MKKRITLILFTVYLISGTGLREIAKLPVLFQHFYEHKLLNNHITFSEYITDHYNNIPHTDDDEDRDNQLPFKQVDSNTSLSPVIPASYFVDLRKPLLPLTAGKTFSRNDHFIPSALISKIWQPPKPGSSIVA
ncbi:hypothetical protein [Chitinophaga niabensis]|uniref:hypothetical protein n=1 Tax=Chitinophaga niabensis TaxID=536979 RepID=UPI0011614EED|nr:hypothetical protein [Chitinophaga niabensis]